MNSRTSTKLFFITFCAVTFTILACRAESFLANVSTPTVAPTRAALRPTFTPPPPVTDTPKPTETAVPSDTPEAPTATLVPTSVPTRRPPTPRPSPVPPTNTPLPQPSNTPVPTPTVMYLFSASSPTCTGASNATDDTVKGTITAGGHPAVGQRVQASSGPGGAPISENPAESDSNGNYTVTIACGTTACNGDFWVWMVNAERQQTSPFIKFHFSDSCRRGVVNFTKTS